MASWRTLLSAIRRIQTEILWLDPSRDFGPRPHPGASTGALRATEQRLGRPLPPSYRAFLEESDGWPRFFEGASLLGTANLGLRLYGDLVSAVFEAAETPVPDLGPPPRMRQHRPILIPFGVDLGATTLFAFNPTVVTPSGEYEVICWVNEIGVRRESFEDFLGMVLELCEYELEGQMVTHTAA
jgi:hypothetical protein